MSKNTKEHYGVDEIRDQAWYGLIRQAHEQYYTDRAYRYPHIQRRLYDNIVSMFDAYPSWAVDRWVLVRESESEKDYLIELSAVPPDTDTTDELRLEIRFRLKKGVWDRTRAFFGGKDDATSCTYCRAILRGYEYDYFDKVISRPSLRDAMWEMVNYFKSKHERDMDMAPKLVVASIRDCRAVKLTWSEVFSRDPMPRMGLDWTDVGHYGTYIPRTLHWGPAYNTWFDPIGILFVSQEVKGKDGPRTRTKELFLSNITGVHVDPRFVVVKERAGQYWYFERSRD